MQRVCSSVVLSSVLLAQAEAAEWVFEWPYTANNECRCKEVESSGAFASYPSKSDCLSAFADNDSEFCSYDMQSGVSEAQCSHAVATDNGLTNEDCESRCTSVVTDLSPLKDFLATCSFQFITDFQELGVSPIPESCFSNYVYGWSDYNPSNLLQAPPLKVFDDVPSAASCQLLCQKVEDCAYFSWRATPGLTASHTSLLTAAAEPMTCLLYDTEYMENVLNHTVTPEDQLEGPTRYCNVAEVAQCADQNTNKGIISDDFCLSCGCDTKCAWKSAEHITGPAFCKQDVTDRCEYVRPVWTTTPKPCEPESTQTESGTANTDTQTTVYETSTTQAPQSTATGQNEYTTEQGTAESDTAVTDQSSSTGTGTTTTDISSTTDATATETTISLSETETTISLSETETEISLSETTVTESETSSTSPVSTGATENTGTEECPCGECPCLDEGMDDSVPNDEFVNDDCYPNCH